MFCNKVGGNSFTYSYSYSKKSVLAQLCCTSDSKIVYLRDRLSSDYFICFSHFSLSETENYILFMLLFHRRIHSRIHTVPDFSNVHVSLLIIIHQRIHFYHRIKLGADELTLVSTL